MDLDLDFKLVKWVEAPKVERNVRSWQGHRKKRRRREEKATEPPSTAITVVRQRGSFADLYR